MSLAAATARRLSHAQRIALRALSDGRVHAVSVTTMAGLIRRELIHAVNDAPALTPFGEEVLAELPGL